MISDPKNVWGEGFLIFFFFILDLLHLESDYFGVANHEFHSPRTVGEAKNALYRGPQGRDLKGGTRN